MRTRYGICALALLGAAAPSLGAPAPLPDRIAPLADVPTSVAVAVDDDGGAIAAWIANGGPRRGVVVRLRATPSGPWGPEQRISPEVPAAGTAPVVAIARRGARAIAWKGPSGLRVYVRAAGSPAFRAAPAPPPASGFTSPALAADPAGPIVLAWAERDASGHWTARRATLRAGAWDPDPPVNLQAAGVVSDPTALAEPVVAVGAWGDTVVGWPRAAVSADQERTVPVRVITRPGRAGGAPGDDRWGPVETLAPAGTQLAVGAGPALQGSPGGYLIVAWTDAGGVHAALRAPGSAAFGPPDVLGPADGVYPVTAVNAEGYAVVAWARFTGTGQGASLVARRRSGASGLWRPERELGTVEPQATLRFREMEAVVDRRRVASVAWPDPAGPGSASVFLSRISAADVVTRPVDLEAGENTEDFALGAGSAGATLIAHRADPDSEPNTTMIAAVAGAPGRVVLSAGQLLINQRIGQAALRRANAVLARLVAVRADHVRNGSLGAADFGPGVHVSGTPSGAAAPNAITPLPIPAGPAGGAAVPVSPAQLLIGQRIAQAALRRASAGRTVLVQGLGGANVVDGQITAAAIAPGLVVTGGTGPPQTPVGAFPPKDAPSRSPVRLPLTAAQLLVNQRIAQEAVLRAQWLVEHLDGGLTGADIRDGSLDSVDLEAALRP